MFLIFCEVTAVYVKQQLFLCLDGSVGDLQDFLLNKPKTAAFPASRK